MATGTINRETSALHRMCTLAVHWGWLDTVPGFPDRLRENPPPLARTAQDDQLLLEQKILRDQA